MNRANRWQPTDWLRGMVALVLAATLMSAAPAHGLGSSRATVPRTVIAASFETNSVLYRIRPRTGRATQIGATGAELTDVAFRGTTLYAIGFSALYTLDTSTGTATFVGPLGVSNANALTAIPRRQALLGADLSGDLLKINRHTGATTVIGTFGHSLVSTGDLAFLRSHLYAAVNRPGTTATLLARVNIRTGKATVVGRTGFRSLYGLTSSHGHLYGGTFGGAIVSISTRTGRGHRLSSSHVAIGGLTS